MDYSEMLTEVSTELNLGTKLDSAIPNKLKQAIKNFETRLTFPYMRVILPVELSEGESQVLLIDALGNKSENYGIRQIKEIEFFRFPNEAGVTPQWTYLKKIDPTDVAEIDEDDVPPAGYWIGDTRTLELDRGADQDYTYNEILASDNSAELGVVLFTDFDRIIGAAQADVWDEADECEEEYIAERWLLENAERALILRTCLNFASTIRDPKLLAMWRVELYGDPDKESTESEWNLLCNLVEEFDRNNEAIYMNPDYSKAAL